jgi:hypothetical protein
MMRLPALRRDLPARYRSDVELRLLCEAYEDAHEALDLRRRSVDRMTTEITEYTHLIGDLETDIRRRVLVSKEQRQDPADESSPWTATRRATRRIVRQIRRFAGADGEREDGRTG